MISAFGACCEIWFNLSISLRDFRFSTQGDSLASACYKKNSSNLITRSGHQALKSI
jgi:hypothetical protein